MSLMWRQDTAQPTWESQLIFGKLSRTSFALLLDISLSLDVRFSQHNWQGHWSISARRKLIQDVLNSVIALHKLYVQVSPWKDCMPFNYIHCTHTALILHLTVCFDDWLIQLTVIWVWSYINTCAAYTPTVHLTDSQFFRWIMVSNLIIDENSTRSQE